MKSNRISLMTLAMGMMLVFAFSTVCHAQTSTPWTIPAKYKTMKNPVATNKESLANAKELYAKHCKSCHGTMGLGDGPKAASLDVTCSDFSSKKFQALSDGEIFFQISEGKGKMPSFKKLIPEDNDRWGLIHYLRTFAAK